MEQMNQVEFPGFSGFPGFSPFSPPLHRLPEAVIETNRDAAAATSLHTYTHSGGLQTAGADTQGTGNGRSHGDDDFEDDFPS